MSKFISAIIEQHTKSQNVTQKGGSDFVPNGGFPPIYVSDKPIVEEDENVLKPRQYSTHKTAVSIKDIMKKRRDVTPVLG